MSILPSQDSFEDVWEKLIKPEMDRYLKVSGVNKIDDPKKRIWEAYKDFNQYCKKNYMSKSVDRIDRHKTVACYMFAIIKTQPLTLSLDNNVPDNIIVTINEHLAITVGLSILCAFMRTDNSKACPNGIILPEAHHGKYRDVFALELYYTRMDDIYNILSLSNTLFLIETYNLSKSSTEN